MYCAVLEWWDEWSQCSMSNVWVWDKHEQWAMSSMNNQCIERECRIVLCTWYEMFYMMMNVPWKKNVLLLLEMRREKRGEVFIPFGRGREVLYGIIYLFDCWQNLLFVILLPPAAMMFYLYPVLYPAVLYLYLPCMYVPIPVVLEVFYLWCICSSTLYCCCYLYYDVVFIQHPMRMYC